MKTIATKNKDELVKWFKETVKEIDFSYEQVVTIKRYYKKRSTELNSLYWMWLTAIANHIGDDRDSLHEAYKRKYLKWEEKTLPGELTHYFPGHTPDQDPQEFKEYMNKIHLHAFHFFGLHLPYPDDENFKKFVEEYKNVRE